MSIDYVNFYVWKINVKFVLASSSLTTFEEQMFFFLFFYQVNQHQLHLVWSPTAKKTLSISTSWFKYIVLTVLLVDLRWIGWLVNLPNILLTLIPLGLIKGEVKIDEVFFHKYDLMKALYAVAQYVINEVILFPDIQLIWFDNLTSS